jgi:hypothetical protein
MPPITTTQIPPPTPDELDELTTSVRKVIAKGHRFGFESTCTMRSLTINAVPGNGCYANLAVFTVAGSPTRGAVCVSMGANGDPVSRHISTGKPLTQAEVDLLRDVIRRLSGAVSNTCVPGNFAWESGARFTDGRLMYPKADAQQS